MRPLTPRQREVLLQIQLHLEQTGFPPTRAEIADALGFRSVTPPKTISRPWSARA